MSMPPFKPGTCLASAAYVGHLQRGNRELLNMMGEVVESCG